MKVRVEGPRRFYRAELDGLARLHAELAGVWGAAIDALEMAAESGDWP